MATLYNPIVDSPFISRLFVKRSEVTVRNLTDFAIFAVPLVAPMTTGSIVFWELITHGLPMENLYGKVAVALVAVFLLEFCGMMFFDYLAQVSRYQYDKPSVAPNINPAWGWAAILSYVGVSFLMLSTGTVIPAIYQFMGYSNNVQLLTPVMLPGFIVLTFFTFKVHQDVSIINKVYEKAEIMAKADEMAIAKAREELNHQQEMELKQQRAKLELLKQEAEIQTLQTSNEVKLLKAKAKVATVKPLQDFTGKTEDEAKAYFQQLYNENNGISSRMASKMITEWGYKVSHVTVSKWLNAVKEGVNVA